MLVSEAIDSEGWDVESATLKANLHKDLGEFGAADATWRSALEALGQSAAGWIERGKIARDAGDFDRALDCLDKAVRLEPDNAYASSHRGLILESLGRFQEALDCQKRALELDPDSGMYAMCVGKLHAKLGSSADAAEYFGKARDLMADETAYNRACLEALAGDPRTALKHLRTFIDANPFARAWARRDPDLESLHQLDVFRQLVA